MSRRETTEEILDNEYLILVALADWSQGLRFGELLSLLREGKPGLARQTLTNRIQALEERWKFIEKDETTKRYMITPRGRDRLRERFAVRGVVNHPHTCFPSKPPREGLLTAHEIYVQVRGLPTISPFASKMPSRLLEKLHGKQVASIGDFAWNYFRSFPARWIRLIFEPLVEGGYPGLEPLRKMLAKELDHVEDLTDEELTKIWRTIFSESHRIVVAEEVDTEDFLAWLKTQQGRRELQSTILEMRR